MDEEEDNFVDETIRNAQIFWAEDEPHSGESIFWESDEFSKVKNWDVLTRHGWMLNDEDLLVSCKYILWFEQGTTNSVDADWEQGGPHTDMPWYHPFKDVMPEHLADWVVREMEGWDTERLEALIDDAEVTADAIPTKAIRQYVTRVLTDES